MEKTKNQTKTARPDFASKSRLKIVGFVTVVIAMAITASICWILYEHTVTLLTENLRERIKAIAITAAVQFDPNDINALQVEGDWQKPEWVKVATQLKKIRENNEDILFAYIFRKTENYESGMEFVSDSHSLNPYVNTDDDTTNDLDLNQDGIIDDSDVLQWPGQEYPEPPEATLEAYDMPTTNKELYEDQWGKVITGYAPIKDDMGVTVAALAVDIRADDFFVITRQTLYPFLTFILTLVGIISVLAASLIRIWNRRVELLAELDRQKDELLSIVSHQLATPISSVKWYLEMLLDGDVGVLKKEQQEYLSTMQSVTVDLTDLVSMILDVSRIQLGKMKIDRQEIDLNAFFGDILSVIEPKANEKHVELTKSIATNLPVAHLDKRLTRMTIENLLSNAVKYTPAKGKVYFTVEMRGSTLYCEVKDTGCGIPEKEQGNIFGKLFRASNTGNIEGNGFGLYVAKGAIEAQSGKIWFESKEGQGTVFHVELPIQVKK